MGWPWLRTRGILSFQPAYGIVEEYICLVQVVFFVLEIGFTGEKSHTDVSVNVAEIKSTECLKNSNSVTCMCCLF